MLPAPPPRQPSQNIQRSNGIWESCSDTGHARMSQCLGRLVLLGSCGAQDEFTLAAIAQNLRRLAKPVARTATSRWCMLRSRCNVSVPFAVLALANFGSGLALIGGDGRSVSTGTCREMAPQDFGAVLASSGACLRRSPSRPA